MTTYLFQLTLGWGLFALLYTFALRGETFFHLNRAYLLLTLMIGLLLPVSVHWLPALPLPADGEPAFVLPAMIVGLQRLEHVAGTATLAQVWRGVYWVGVALTVLRLLWGLARLSRIAQRSQLVVRTNAYMLLRTPEATLPFSFFRLIYIPPGFEAHADHEKMLAHEKAHVTGWHSADVLFVEIVGVFLWFHPLVYWYRKALRAVHEYIADEQASVATDRRQYGLLLIRQSQSNTPVAFAHHFFQSPLKQRLIMLTKQSSAPANGWKYGLLAPSVALMWCTARLTPALTRGPNPNQVEHVRQQEADAWNTTDTGATFDPKTHMETAKVKRRSPGRPAYGSGQPVYRVVDRQPEFPGGMAALAEFLQKRLVYPGEDLAARRTGMVLVGFVVDTEGAVEQVMADTSAGAPSPAMVNEALRVVRLSPRWTPAEFKGEKVKCRMKLPVQFRI